jgi:hypothetical protein
LSVNDLRIGDILDTVAKTKNDNELENFLRNELRKLEDIEVVEATKEITEKKDLDRLDSLLEAKDSSDALKSFVLWIMLTIGGEEEGKVLDQWLFKNENLKFLDTALQRLLWFDSTFPIAPRLELLFKILNKGARTEESYLKALEEEIRQKGLTPELMEAIEYEASSRKSGEAKVLESVMPVLKDLSSIDDNKEEIKAYRDKIRRYFVQYLDSNFDKADVDFDISVNAAQILENINQERDIIDAIGRNFQGNPRSIYLAGKHGGQDFVRDLANELRNEDDYLREYGDYYWDSYRDLIIDALEDIGTEVYGSGKIGESVEPEFEEATDVLAKMLCKTIKAKPLSIKDETLSMKLLRTIDRSQINGSSRYQSMWIFAHGSFAFRQEISLWIPRGKVSQWNSK